MSGETPPPPEEPRPYRLDPERAAGRPDASAGQPDPSAGRPDPSAGQPDHSAGQAEPPAPPPVEPAIDTRRYRWMIGIFGLVLVAAFSVYSFTTRGVQTAGVPAGRQLHRFVAPLAGAHLTGAANMNPHCDPAHPNPQALNVCGREPLVLGLFVTGSTDCKRQIDTLQTVSREFRHRAVQFAAVAIAASNKQTQALVRSHRWTIPVAYDPDGRVGALFGVSICPMVELAYRGGVVADRLIGNDWLSAPALAARVRAMLAGRR